jgi:hypothetical protein
MQASTSWDDVAFSSTEGDRHLGIRPVSQLNTWPATTRSYVLLAGPDSFVIDHDIPFTYERPLCARSGHS